MSSLTSPPHANDLAFDHLGLLVRELATGRTFLQTAMGIDRWTAPVDDPGLGVSVQFGEASSHGGPVYELVTPLGDASPVAQQLDRSRGILNHTAYTTADLEAAGEHLRAAGCFPAGEPSPALAYDGQRVQFWMSPLRFLIELIEKPGHRHAFVAADAAGDEHLRTSAAAKVGTEPAR